MFKIYSGNIFRIRLGEGGVVNKGAEVSSAIADVLYFIFLWFIYKKMILMDDMNEHLRTKTGGQVVEIVKEDTENGCGNRDRNRYKQHS